MVKPTQPLHRATEELKAAAQAMRNALALFETIAFAEGHGDARGIDIQALSWIGIELLGPYAERAQGEAEWFEEARNA